jgi:carboxypeptidase family protein
VSGTVRDETGGTLPGVTVQLRSRAEAPQLTVTDALGGYAFDAIPPGPVAVTFTLINFASLRREVAVRPGAGATLDVVLHLRSMLT